MNKPFLPDIPSPVSYAELLDAANRAASVRRRIQCKSLFEFSRDLLAALSRGVSVEIVDSDMSEDELAALSQAAPDAEIPLSPASFGSLGGLLDAAKNSAATLTLFTSGTTGRPKSVSHTMRSISKRIRVSPKHAGDVWGFAYNPSHMAGIQVLLQALANGNPLVNLFGLPAEEVAGKIARHKITHISATPTFYRMLAGAGAEFPNVVRATFGGERVDEPLCRRVEKMFPSAKINNVYASTEAGALFACDGDAFSIPPDIADSVKISDGEILLRRDILGTSESFSFDADGFYRTGDKIEWADADKTKFRIVARANGMVNVGGYKVNPAEVEAALRGVEGIADAAVFGKKNSVLGNILCADIVAERGAEIDEPALRKKLAESLQQFKIPRIVKFVEKLETTRTGKVKRA